MPNASPYERGKHAQRDAVLAARTRERGGHRLCQRGRWPDALVFDGASVVADGDGTVHPAAAAFVDQWLVVEYDGETRRFMPRVWMDDGDESMDALARRAVTRGIGTTAARTASRRCGWGCPVALIRRWYWRWRSTRSALGTLPPCACRRAIPPACPDLAAEQCRALGVKLEAVSIEPAFKGLMESLAPMFEGTAPDVTEENLQSRSRG